MLIDISRPVAPQMVIYPGNPVVQFSKVQEADEQHSALTEISLGSHTGTHIDAPAHIRADGVGVEMYDLEAMNGAVQVVDVSHLSSVISAADIPDLSEQRVIFKTRNSNQDITVFDPDFVALDESAAEVLVEKKVQLVGIDGLSIKKKGVKDQVHAVLLDAGIVIVEGMWLSSVKPGIYELMCLPLAVEKIDGAPVRAVLRNIDKN